MYLGKFKSFTLSLIVLFLVFGILPVNKTFAVSPSSILVDVNPPNPNPYEDVTINLNSYSSNLDSVSIAWSVGNVTSLYGIGKKTFSFKSGGAGSETTVKATISLPDGVIEKTITIRPAVMVLLWQADDSYVPPFYKGKAMPTADSEIKIVAMPEFKNNGLAVNSKNMTYDWKKDYTNNVDGSGYGKNFFIYDNDYLEGTNNISVNASTVDQNYSSDASIDVVAGDPKILFYRYDNTLGALWEKALVGPYRLQDKDIVLASPYFISPKQLNHPYLSWNWTINDNPVNVTSFAPNLMPLAVQNGVSGSSKLDLEINNSSRIFQTANAELNIDF